MSTALERSIEAQSSSIAARELVRPGVSWGHVKRLKRPLKLVGGLCLGLYLIPTVFLAYLACGLWDFSRNRDRSLSTLERYFVGNGLFTWLLSPFNLLLDVLCLPYRNRGIYRQSDLPPAYQEEVSHLIDAVHRHDLVGQLKAKMGEHQRGMMFFKWYGKNLPTSLEFPEFHRDYKYIRTIGVSVFNKRQSTGKHFGPLRVTLRLLYNINPIDSDQVYIQVGDQINYWRDNQLFIFDDTLQHQSVNGSDGVRYCMFVDILRPTLVPRLLSGILTGVRFVAEPINAAFYKKWTFVK